MNNNLSNNVTNREAIITVVGFLGAGKTTLLRRLIGRYLKQGWSPFVILNDYENADMDAMQMVEQLSPKWIRPLSGSCICCSGIHELRGFVNSIPAREHGITFIEANGTSDACSLMGFLGVGIDDRFLPPVQVSVVDVKNWQQRGEHNELEANQVQVSSLLVLTHLDSVTEQRKAAVIEELKALNPVAEITEMDEMDETLLPQLSPSQNKAQPLEHLKAHWSSTSVDLPTLPDEASIRAICQALPVSLLRVKGCTQLGNDSHYTYFERTPDGTVSIKPFYGVPTTGAKLLTVGPGSEPDVLNKAIDEGLLQKQ